LTVISLPISVIFSIFLSLLLIALSPVVGIGVLLVLLIIIIYVYKKTKFANGVIDFIDVNDNTIYLIADGIFRLKYKKYKFDKLEKIVFVDHIVLVLLRRYRRFVVKGIFDGLEYNLHISPSRKASNRIINELVEAYNVEVEYSLGEHEIEDYPFTDTSYSYASTPSSYLFTSVIGAAIIFIGAYIFSFSVITSCLIMIVGVAIAVRYCNCYLKSKKELSLVKRSL
jgi:hypothetical protein